MNINNPDIVVRHIKTKNKTRKIITYRSEDCELKTKHRRINTFLKERFIPSIFTKGYVKGRSIYDNALPHMYNDYFILLDIKDFFPHICHKQLAAKIFREINLVKENQINKKECNDIVDCCSIGSRGLPLGFITSPILSNIYLKEFDCIFYGYLKKMELNNVIYTRYADDIIISFKTDSFGELKETENDIVDTSKLLLSRYGLQINNRKTRAYNLNVSNHVRITGINIIKSEDGYRHLTVGRKLKNELFWNAIECFETKNQENIQTIKGLQSFVLSIEKLGYESCFSEGMFKKVNDLGFQSLKELIDSL